MLENDIPVPKEPPCSFKDNLDMEGVGAKKEISASLQRAAKSSKNGIFQCAQDLQRGYMNAPHGISSPKFKVQFSTDMQGRQKSLAGCTVVWRLIFFFSVFSSSWVLFKTELQYSPRRRTQRELDEIKSPLFLKCRAEHVQERTQTVEGSSKSDSFHETDDQTHEIQWK